MSRLLHHQIDGDGPPFVLLHPVGLDLTFFDPLVAELNGRYRTLRIDLGGHGQSPPLHSAPALADYADDVHELMRAIGWTPGVVVGFSFGGMIAQMLALAHPGDVRALVLGACPCTFPDADRLMLADRGAQAEREGMASVVDATLARWFTERFRSGGGDRAARTRLLADDAAGWASAWRAIARLDTAARLFAITVPTLCLAGEADRSAPPEAVKMMAGRISGSHFVVVPGAPHMLFIEQPEATATAIREFLDDALIPNP